MFHYGAASREVEALANSGIAHPVPKPSMGLGIYTCIQPFSTTPPVCTGCSSSGAAQENTRAEETRRLRQRRRLQMLYHTHSLVHVHGGAGLHLGDVRPVRPRRSRPPEHGKHLFNVLLPEGRNAWEVSVF